MGNRLVTLPFRGHFRLAVKLEVILELTLMGPCCGLDPFDGKESGRGGVALAASPQCFATLRANLDAPNRLDRQHNSSTLSGAALGLPS